LPSKKARPFKLRADLGVSLLKRRRMKLGKYDIPIKIKISGIQLAEFQKHSWYMIEAFGLDTKVDKKKSTF